MTETKRKTIGEMEVGDFAQLHPSDVKLQGMLNFWVHPDRPVYNAPNLGARIERTEKGYTVRVDPGKGSPAVWHGDVYSLKKAGYIKVTWLRFRS